MSQNQEKKQSSPRKKTLKPKLRLHFGDAIAMGPGKVDLLHAIQETGSILGAAKQMHMSYRRAWLLIDTMNQSFHSPLVETTKGGKGGGGARITDLGQEVILKYSQMVESLNTSEEMEELVKLLADSPPKDPH